MKTDLSIYNNDWYQPGAGKVKRIFWFIVNLFFFQTGFHWTSAFKRSLLRLFGAQIGKGVVIKPSVNIKYPWNLVVGDYAWIGEKVWIDNLGMVKIGPNACLSQGAMLLCGNHDYTSPSFDLMVGDIILEEGSWIGARSLVGPGVTVKSHAVLTAGSIATSDMETYTIYRGNPAVKVKKREIIEK